MRTNPNILALLALVLTATPAAAFDCAKASTVVEKAICASPDLKTADDALAAAYSQVKALTPEASQKMLARSQRRWIAERERNCPTSETGLDACIGAMTGERVKLFNGAAVSGPGPGGRIIPLFIEQEGTEKVYDLDITMLRFADARTDGEKLFNGLADKIAARIKTGNHGEDTMGRIYALDEAMTLSFASPDFISVEHTFWADTGGAHGNGGSENSNIDMRNARILAIGDLFAEPAVLDLIAQCKTQLIAEKKARWGSEPYDPATDTFLADDVIGEHVATLSRWSFTDVEASVRFDAYAIGSYAEGTYDCTFPMNTVKAMALPDAPLP